MKQVYGEFCSHHMEAVNVFKELQQQNKKLQNFVRVSSFSQDSCVYQNMMAKCLDRAADVLIFIFSHLIATEQ